MQAVAEGSHRPALEVRSGRERGQGVVQKLGAPALPYPRSSRILNSVCQGRSLGHSLIYIFIYLGLVYGPQMLEMTLN